jgi:hypothetical protein
LNDLPILIDDTDRCLLKRDIQSGVQAHDGHSPLCWSPNLPGTEPNDRISNNRALIKGGQAALLHLSSAGSDILFAGVVGSLALSELPFLSATRRQATATISLSQTARFML